MWLIHTETGEHGWHICQTSQIEPCDRLVFVDEGGIWRVKMWKSTETRIRATTHAEELEDELAMRSRGFPLP